MTHNNSAAGLIGVPLLIAYGMDFEVACGCERARDVVVMDAPPMMPQAWMWRRRGLISLGVACRRCHQMFNHSSCSPAHTPRPLSTHLAERWLLWPQRPARRVIQAITRRMHTHACTCAQRRVPLIAIVPGGAAHCMHGRASREATRMYRTARHADDVALKQPAKHSTHPQRGLQRA